MLFFPTAIIFPSLSETTSYAVCIPELPVITSFPGTGFPSGSTTNTSILEEEAVPALPASTNELVLYLLTAFTDYDSVRSIFRVKTGALLIFRGILAINTD